MIINFIGNYQGSYTNELADETHLCDEIEALGHIVHRIPRDIWKAHCEGHKNPDWKCLEDLKADLSIFCKWPHFIDGSYIGKMKEESGAKCWYWTWDYMQWSNVPMWHIQMAQTADLHLTNEGGDLEKMKKYAIKPYYFPFDASSKEFDKITVPNKVYDVSFFGSHFQAGNRLEWLKIINKKFPVNIWAFNWEAWQKEGFRAYPAVWGNDFALKVAESKIILGFNVNDHCWGYWSNRVGKVLTVGGFLLQRYVPGMELFLRDGAEYFSSPDEAIAKIDYYLKNDEEREKTASRGYEIGREKFTSKARVKELMILADRFLKGGLNEI